jgi:hypothetical protein
MLPIELVNFDAVYNGKSVDTKWSTASELNNDYFTLERSSDGQTFTEITRVASKANGGNSSSMLSYGYTDQDIHAGTYYYRLKQTDKDLRSEFSSVVPVSIVDDQGLFTLAPNPAADEVQVSYFAYDDNPCVIRVHDVTGKVILEHKLISKRGMNTHSLDLSGQVSGLYFITLSTGANSYSAKLARK